MSALKILFDGFHHALLSKNASDILPHIQSSATLSPAKRLAIYIDGYRIRLVSALRADYPALLAVLGDASFDTLARAYVDAHPPEHYNLDRYPHGFAAFARKERSDVFAAELATLEGAIAQIFMGDESVAFSVVRLQELPPDALSSQRFLARSASALLAFSYPVHTYLECVRQGEHLDRPVPKNEWVLVVRHENEVRRHLLCEKEYSVLQALYAGQPFAEAVANLTDDDAMALQAWMEKWFAHGFFKEQSV